MFARAPLWLKTHLISILLGSLAVVVSLIIVSCGGSTSIQSPSMGTVSVSLGDPPSCAASVGAAAVPPGTFSSVWITIQAVKAHISSTADANSPGWQELAPQLNSAPIQLDLLHLPANGQCLLQQLGSASLPAGDYQQIRLILLANAATSTPPSSNACASLGNVFNCVVDGSGGHTLDLSSEQQTGLKIPPGQIMGGPIHVTAGQSVDLNIHFNTCASIIRQGNGDFRLKPVLTAGVVSANMTGISGEIVDSITSTPIAGAIVTLQVADKSGIDHIAMESQTDSTGHFGFCPLAMGIVFDVVVDGMTSSGTAYDATVVFNVTGGTNLGAVPLIAETAATAGASTGAGMIQGTVTAVSGTTGAKIDATVGALQTVIVSNMSHTFTVPPFQKPASLVVQVSSSTSCPTGSPTGAFCGSYSLIVPASNPNVGTISAGKISFTAPVSGDVLYTVEADATNPTSNMAICSPSSQTTSKDSNGMPLKVTAGTTTDSARIDFSACS